MCKVWILIFAALSNSNFAYAWNSLGHKLVAQIAYDNLSLSTRQQLISYNNLLNTKGRKYSLIDSAIWMDTLYAEKYKDLRKLHYVDTPLIIGNSKPPKLDTYNALFAVNIAQYLYQDARVSQLDKALAFRILWHVVADLHQPLHAISRYSKSFPEGDRGGNLEILPKNKVAKNLHAYWDRGGGALLSHKPYSKKQVKQLAMLISKKWPCVKEKAYLSPAIWAKESWQIARDFAYSSKFDGNYQKKTQNLSYERIAIAGCRLAALLDRQAGYK